jgi:hypothetical protein
LVATQATIHGFWHVKAIANVRRFQLADESDQKASKWVALHARPLMAFDMNDGERVQRNVPRRAFRLD